VNRPPDLRTLRERRERDEDWIRYSSWTAIGTSVIASLFIVGITVDEPGALAQAAPLLSMQFGHAAVGYKLLSRSQWAAWGLLATYAVSCTLTAMRYGFFTGIVGKLVLTYVYVRGWLATLDYPEVCQEIAALSAESTHPGHAV
jgi:hypothetical protein